MTPKRMFARVLEIARANKWEVTRCTKGHGHYQLKSPDPRVAPIHVAESGDPRAIKNTISALRRAGLEV